jgi:hypothetical protein
MKKVTAWIALNFKESKEHPSHFVPIWEHNHIEDGWIGLTYTPLFGSSAVPQPKFPNQKKVWEGKKWKKQYCYIDDNQVVTEA